MTVLENPLTAEEVAAVRKPYRAASLAQRSRHASGVDAGTSRWAPASQVTAQARGTTR